MNSVDVLTFFGDKGIPATSRTKIMLLATDSLFNGIPAGNVGAALGITDHILTLTGLLPRNVFLSSGQRAGDRGKKSIGEKTKQAEYQ